MNGGCWGRDRRCRLALQEPDVSHPHEWGHTFTRYRDQERCRDAIATLKRVETKWLEDFVSLAETRSFSRSALLRHITQPAFSRRIQALEA